MYYNIFTWNYDCIIYHNSESYISIKSQNTEVQVPFYSFLTSKIYTWTLVSDETYRKKFAHRIPPEQDIINKKGVLAFKTFYAACTCSSRSWYTSANERFTKQSRTILMIFRPMSGWNRNIVFSLDATCSKRNFALPLEPKKT